MAEILILSGKLQGRKLSLPTGEIYIGRDEACQIRIASHEISRRHCVIQDSPEGLTIQDLDSRNGTLVNDVPIDSRVTLKPGDVVRVGPMHFQIPAAPSPSVAATPESPANAPRPATAGAAAEKKAKPAKGKKTTDADIVGWLATDAGEEPPNSGDTTIIRGSALKPDAAAPAPSPSAPAPSVESRKGLRTVADEAAEIIRRHHEKLRQSRTPPR